MNAHRRNRITLALSAAFVLACSGCQMTPYASDTGSTMVSALSVTRWSDYKDTLSPSYDFKESQALLAATPDTRSFESAILDSFRAQVAVRVAPSAQLLPGFAPPVAPAGSPSGTPASQPGVSAAGTPAPGAQSPGSMLSGPAPRIDPTAAVPSATNLGKDEFLKFYAGTALFQEVKLLERYVKDAVRLEGYEAFIVRLQIANQPFADRKAFDAYANIAFFSGPVAQQIAFIDRVESASLALAARFRAGPEVLGNDPTKGTAQSLENATQKLRAALETIQSVRKELISNATRALRDLQGALAAIDELPQGVRDQAGATLTEYRESAEALIASLECLAEKPDRSEQLPVVIPMLVTDQVESALLSGRFEELRELSLLLSAAYAGIGGDVNLQKVDQVVQKAAGRSYRSLFTVGRLADNMVRVRMGARARPDAREKETGLDYETMPRTYTVSVLLLVKKGSAAREKVYVATRYEYRDPSTGERFRSKPNTEDGGSDLRERVQRFVTNYDTKLEGASVDHSVALFAAAQGNEYPEFMKTFRLIVANDGSSDAANLARRLYMDMNIAKLGANFDSTSFEVTFGKAPDPCAGDKQAILTDNGQFTECVINGISGIDPEQAYAVWRDFRGSAGAAPRTLASTGASLRGKSQLVIRFPSLIKLQYIDEGGVLDCSGKIELSYMQGTTTTSCGAIEKPTFIAAGAPADAPSLVISRGTTQIPATSGEAAPTIKLGFVVKGTPSSPPDAKTLSKFYRLKFEGADVTLVGKSGEAAVAAASSGGVVNQFVVSKTGEAEFALKSLVAGTDVVVTITPPDNGAGVSPIKYTVVAPAGTGRPNTGG